VNVIEQQIAIAESQGYQNVRSIYDVTGMLVGWREDADPKTCKLPNYTGCLNAMHEVENNFYKRAGMFEFERYITHLQHIMNRVPPVQENMFFVSASASQRAEAYLRTINKWKD